MKAVDGRLCMTECHAPGVGYFNPVTCTTVYTAKPSCAVMPLQDHVNYISTCHVDREKGEELQTELVMPSELELLLSLPFDAGGLLIDAYNIENLNDYYVWLESNASKSERAANRVHSCIWKMYLTKPSDLPDNLLVWYYQHTKPAPDFTYNQFYEAFGEWIERSIDSWSWHVDLWLYLKAFVYDKYQESKVREDVE